MDSAAAAAAGQQAVRRLKWRCRRGTKELDVLLERYACVALPQADPSERAALMRLLELPDPLLTDYLLGWATPEEPLVSELVRRIRAIAPQPLPEPASPALPGCGSPGAAQASSIKDPC